LPQCSYAYATVTVMRQVLTAIIGHCHGYAGAPALKHLCCIEGVREEFRNI